MLVGTVYILSSTCDGQLTESLEQRIAQADGSAILEAADRGRSDLIPALEDLAAAKDFSPVSTATTARKALGKLGVRKYVDSFVKELVDSTNSESYVYWLDKRDGDSMEAKYFTRIEALKTLLYLGDKSTVRAIASALSDTERPAKSSHVIYDSPALMAAWTLTKMNLENPPDVDKVKFPSTEVERDILRKWIEDHPGQDPFASAEERIAAWQRWWEQNKDKYP